MGLCASGPEDVRGTDDFDGNATAANGEGEDHEKTKGGSLIIHRRMSANNSTGISQQEEAVIDTTKGGSMLINQKVLQYA